jgi:hypothetical protein
MTVAPPAVTRSRIRLWEIASILPALSSTSTRGKFSASKQSINGGKECDKIEHIKYGWGHGQSGYF